MPARQSNRLLRPESLTGVGIILASAALLVPIMDLRPISALLPAAMLGSLIILSLILVPMDQRKASAGEQPAPVTRSPRRVIGAFALIAGYAIATDLFGFYPSTAVAVPLVAWLFGYRNPLGLLLATVIVVGAIWVIFDFAMSQEFPVGRLWQE
ncbi:tripartite tricarboxylate transporter TctB family protein [Pseudooceanicola nanhaiensis]|uniref:tripartite tricarboxylate transporter TctB family protein n=1 Tax=Pseudooceanicola nanhaiensis TaxID=375761 RepID=UPI0035111D9F